MGQSWVYNIPVLHLSRTARNARLVFNESSWTDLYQNYVKKYRLQRHWNDLMNQGDSAFWQNLPFEN